MRKLTYVIVSLFCLDSLVKLSIGTFYLHFAVLLILLALVKIMIDKPNTLFSKAKSVLNDTPVIIFTSYTFIHSWFALNINVYCVMLLYLILFLLVYLYFNISTPRINTYKLAYTATVLLVVTGLTQYIAQNIFSFEITLRGLDASYYAGKENFNERLRGFFLEPNWYGLVAYSWLYLFLSSSKSNKLTPARITLSVLVFVCISLSQNRLIYTFLFAQIILFIIPARLKRLKKWMPVVFTFLTGIIFVFLSLNLEAVNDRSAMARLFTANNVIADFIRSDIFTKLVGHGFSNWGYYSNTNGISWSNSLNDQALTRRDNAESYVILFEMGVIGAIIFIYDLFFVSKKTSSPADALYISTITTSAFFYPIYTFMFYLIPYVIVRNRIIRNSEATDESEGRLMTASTASPNTKQQIKLLTLNIVQR